MKPASDAQIRFLHAWRKDAREEVRSQFKTFLREVGEEYDVDSLDSRQASQIISQMVANFGEPHKPGKDDLRHEDGEHYHDGEGEDGNDGEGQGNGEGEGQGQGDGKMENNFRDGSKESKVAEKLIENDLDVQKTYDDLKDELGTEPLNFKKNVDGSREPLEMGSDSDKTNDQTQKGRLKKLINDTKRKLEEQKGEQKQQEQGGGDGKGKGQGGGDGKETDAEYLRRKLKDARKICADKDADGKPFKDFGLRPAIYGAKMLNAGLPVSQILDAMMMDWPKEIRTEVMEGKVLKPFDITTLWKQERVDGQHPAVPAIVRLALAGVPIFMIGGHGTGKTTIAEQVNEILNDKHGREGQFGFASMTAGTSPGEFKGRITLDGFLPSLFCEIYENGGVFLFDELDAGESNLLTLLNSALANGWFVNNKGQKLRQHEHFVPIAAGNTQGLGANTRYTGRNRLDAATLDRWNMGRVRVEFSEQLEETLYWDIINSKS